MDRNDEFSIEDITSTIPSMSPDDTEEIELPSLKSDHHEKESTYEDFNNLEPEEISLATSYVDQEEGKELEDFLFDTMQNIPEIPDLEDESIKEVTENIPIITSLEDEDLSAPEDKTVDPVSKDKTLEDDDSASEDKTFEYVDTVPEEKLFEYVDDVIGFDEPIEENKVSEEELNRLAEQNKVFESMQDEYFEEDEDEAEKKALASLEEDKNLGALHDAYDEIYEEETIEPEEEIKLDEEIQAMNVPEFTAMETEDNPISELNEDIEVSEPVIKERVEDAELVKPVIEESVEDTELTEPVPDESKEGPEVSETEVQEVEEKAEVTNEPEVSEPIKKVVVTAKVPVKTVNKEPRVITNIEMTLGEHLKENAKEMKPVSKVEKIIGVIIIIIIIIVAFLLIRSVIKDEPVITPDGTTTTTTLPSVKTKSQSTTTTNEVITVSKTTTTAPDVELTPNIPN